MVGYLLQRVVMPEKLPVYRRLFARDIDVDPRWARRLAMRVARLHRSTGLPGRSFRSPASSALQLALPGLGRPSPAGSLNSSA